MPARRRRLPELEVAVEEITPEVAQKWLEWNDRNRKLSPRLVTTYAETMRAGEWRLNGEPIIFDSANRLQSGQHRLHAVIAADTAIWSLVVRGAEPEALFTLDAGRKRTLGDALTLRGEKDVNNLAAATVWVWRWKNDLMDRPGETATTAHLLAVLDETPELREILTIGRRVRDAVGYSVGVWTSFYWAASQVDQEDADVFMEKLITGADLAQKDPVLALRRWLSSRVMDRPKPSNTSVLAITAKAWNAFRDHRSVTALSFKGGEVFPTLI